MPPAGSRCRSRHSRRLEAEIGTTLIERGNRTIALTTAGEMLLEEARALLARADHAVMLTRDAAAGRVGSMRLGYVGSAMYGRLPALIRSFRRSHPDVRLELREATTTAQLAALHAGELDMSIAIPPFGEGGGLHVKAFDTDRLAIALPVAHHLAERDAVRLSDLADEPFILWPSREGRGFHDRVIQLCTGAGFAPDVAQEAHSMHGVLPLVAVETDVSVVPASMAAVRSTEIVYRPLDDDQAAFELVACRREEGASPATLVLFSALLDSD